jgi:hypothetical protein
VYVENEASDTRTTSPRSNKTKTEALEQLANAYLLKINEQFVNDGAGEFGGSEDFQCFLFDLARTYIDL